MNQAALERVLADFEKEMESILVSKGPSYSGAVDGTADRLANFKRCGVAIGTTPVQALWLYALKHVDSISTWVRTGHESEPIRGRLLDLANYCVLFAALLVEGEERPRPPAIIPSNVAA